MKIDLDGTPAELAEFLIAMGRKAAGFDQASPPVLLEHRRDVLPSPDAEPEAEQSALDEQPFAAPEASEEASEATTKIAEGEPVDDRPETEAKTELPIAEPAPASAIGRSTGHRKMIRAALAAKPKMTLDAIARTTGIERDKVSGHLTKLRLANEVTRNTGTKPATFSLVKSKVAEPRNTPPKASDAEPPVAGAAVGKSKSKAGSQAKVAPVAATAAPEPVAAYPIRNEDRIITKLRETPDLTATEIAKTMDINVKSVSALMGKLFAAGRVKRTGLGGIHNPLRYRATK